MYLIFLCSVTLATVLLPLWDAQPLTYLFPKQLLKSAPVWLPITAGLCFAVAGYLPDIHISDQTHTFQEHFVGGGLYCALLLRYFTLRLGLKLRGIPTLLVLFAFTCSLGVMNELLEFVVTKFHLISINIADTSWDLVANTCGAVTGYLLSGIQPLFSRRRQK